MRRFRRGALLIAAAALGGPAPAPVRVGTAPDTYSFAGTGFRQPFTGGSGTTSPTVTAATEYQYTQQTCVAPDYPTKNPRFWVQAFWTNGSGVEVMTTSKHTWRAVGISINNGPWIEVRPLLFPWVMDPALHGAGRLTPPFVRADGSDIDIPALAQLRFRYSRQFDVGATVPTSSHRGQVAPLVDSTMGGTTNFDARTIDGGAIPNNTNQLAVYPAMLLLQGGDGRPAYLAIGNSIGYGQDQGTSGLVYNGDKTFGMIETGLFSNSKGTKRISGHNMCIPGNGVVGQWDTQAGIARKLETLQKITAELGYRPCDMLFNEHVTNSVSAGAAAIISSTRAMIQLFRGALGANLTCVGVEGVAKPDSTDGYQTVANQTPQSNCNYAPPTINALWAYNEAVGGPNGLGDPNATLRSDGALTGGLPTYQHSIAPWRYGSADTGNNRDVLRVLTFTDGGGTATITSGDMPGGASGSAVTFTLSRVPRLLDQLFVFNTATGAQVKSGIVHAITGNQVTVFWNTATNTPVVAAEVSVAVTMHAGALHPGGYAHAVIYAEAFVDFKVAQGLVA